MRNPYISLLCTAWKYAGNQRRQIVKVFGLFICANVLFSLNPLLLGWFVGAAQKDSSKITQYALLYAGAYLTLKLLEWCFHGPARVMERTLALRLSQNFMQEKYHQTLHLTPKWHQEHHSGETISRVRKAYEALRGFFDGGFTYIHTITKFIFSVTAIIIFSPMFGLIAVGLGTITVLVITKFDKPLIKSLSEVNKKEHRVSANLFDSLSNIRTVITLRLESSMEKGLLRKLMQVSHPFRKNAVINEWKWFVAEMMITVIYCVIVLGFVYQHWQPGKEFYIAGLVTLLGYVNQFTSVFQNVASQYTALVQFKTNMSEADDITDAYKTKHRPDRPASLPTGWQSMRIKQINFSHRKNYDDQFRPQSLHDIHMHIQRGNKIALIGQSGSGKSTLMSLLRGLYIPNDEAEVIVDGQPFTMDAIYQSATLFPQEPEIFENTIEYNVTMGIPCSKEEIDHVCEIADFNQVIDQMPEGLMSSITEKGVNLSGGQKQRLALARGVLAAKDSDIILLDEPTSSVDPATESRIYERLFQAFNNKAVISSIHRLHLLEHFDYIYLLDKGKIIDEGSFNQLLETSSAFKEMWDHQRGQVFQMAG